MNSIFSIFSTNTEFLVFITLFFTLTLSISIIVVIFLTKIKTLNSILAQAKEIDSAKIKKIEMLERELEEQKRISRELDIELRFMPRNKKRLNDAIDYIRDLKDKLQKKSVEHSNILNKLRVDFEQLKIHYDLLQKSYNRLQDRYNDLKRKNEELIEDNNTLHVKLRDINLAKYVKNRRVN